MNLRVVQGVVPGEVTDETRQETPQETPQEEAWVSRLWMGSDPAWTDLRAEQIFHATLGRLEARRRRRQATLVALRVTTLALLVFVGLGLAAFAWSGDRTILPG